MTSQQIFQKLTKGDQVRFKDNTVLYYSNNLNGLQGFFQNEFGTGNYRKNYSNIISINGKQLNEQNMDLTQIIKEEIDNILNSQKQETLTFESDPIEYIIQRYPSLDATLIDLMTNTYKDYITGIYVMAPKPTTFKILLHNGQSFYLIYNPKGYIAKISGKQYHLMSLKDEEYAIKAIAKLLMMGIPPSSQGPDMEESGEMDSKDAFVSDMTSEPDLGNIDATPEVEPEGEETPPEEEEELQEEKEPKKVFKLRIIKEIKIEEPISTPTTIDGLIKYFHPNSKLRKKIIDQWFINNQNRLNGPEWNDIKKKWYEAKIEIGPNNYVGKDEIMIDDGDDNRLYIRTTPFPDNSSRQEEIILNRVKYYIQYY